ncbi:MAG: DbpA RNA binding domain-containing protein [Spirochaetales bacterium]|nr:DbpA RNA binding domain-containing protein [Spirochaetales bacterium]
MPTDSAPNKLPEEALIAFLDGIRAELSSPSDPVMLNQVRSFFRKHIPLHLRSYAAALLILRAAGMSSGQGSKANPKAKPMERTRKASTSHKSQEPVRTQDDPARAPADAKTKQNPSPALPRSRPEGMVPLFVSMGKRQRLRPQELRVLIAEKTGLPQEELGRVHLFDNYSFIDVPEANAEKIVAACEGAALKNRPLEIKPAKKKNEGAKDSEG